MPLTDKIRNQAFNNVRKLYSCTKNALKYSIIHQDYFMCSSRLRSKAINALRFYSTSPFTSPLPTVLLKPCFFIRSASAVFYLYSFFLFFSHLKFPYNFINYAICDKKKFIIKKKNVHEQQWRMQEVILYIQSSEVFSPNRNVRTWWIKNFASQESSSKYFVGKHAEI